MHCAVYGTEFKEVGIGDEYSKHLLDNMQISLPSVFMELTHTAWGSYSTFTIPSTFQSALQDINCPFLARLNCLSY